MSVINLKKMNDSQKIIANARDAAIAELKDESSNLKDTASRVQAKIQLLYAEIDSLKNEYADICKDINSVSFKISETERVLGQAIERAGDPDKVDLDDLMVMNKLEVTRRVRCGMLPLLTAKKLVEASGCYKDAEVADATE